MSRKQLHWTQRPENKARVMRMVRASVKAKRAAQQQTENGVSGQIREWALLGAKARVEAISQEIADITATFPELRKAASRR